MERRTFLKATPVGLIAASPIVGLAANNSANSPSSTPINWSQRHREERDSQRRRILNSFDFVDGYDVDFVKDFLISHKIDKDHVYVIGFMSFSEFLPEKLRGAMYCVRMTHDCFSKFITGFYFFNGYGYLTADGWYNNTRPYNPIPLPLRGSATAFHQNAFFKKVDVLIDTLNKDLKKQGINV